MGNIHVKLYELNQWFSRRYLLKIFLILGSCGPPVQWSETIYAILKKGHMGNIHVKLYEIWNGGSGGDRCRLKTFLI